MMAVYFEDYYLNGMLKFCFISFQAMLLPFYHLVFRRKLLLPSLRLFHIKACQYLKMTLNGLFTC